MDRKLIKPEEPKLLGEGGSNRITVYGKQDRRTLCDALVTRMRGRGNRDVAIGAWSPAERNSFSISKDTETFHNSITTEKRRRHTSTKMTSELLSRSMRFQSEISDWEGIVLSSGLYVGDDLREWGFPYAPGTYVPVTERYSVMLQYRWAFAAKSMYDGSRTTASHPEEATT